MRLQCKENFFFFYVFFSAQRENKKNLFYRESKNQGSCFAENKEKSCTRPQRIFFGERRRIKFKFVNKVFQAFHRLPFKKKIFFAAVKFAKKIFPRIFSKRKIFAQTVRCRAAEKLF